MSIITDHFWLQQISYLVPVEREREREREKVCVCVSLRACVRVDTEQYWQLAWQGQRLYRRHGHHMNMTAQEKPASAIHFAYNALHCCRAIGMTKKERPVYLAPSGDGTHRPHWGCTRLSARKDTGLATVGCGRTDNPAMTSASVGRVRNTSTRKPHVNSACPSTETTVVTCTVAANPPDISLSSCAHPEPHTHTVGVGRLTRAGSSGENTYEKTAAHPPCGVRSTPVARHCGHGTSAWGC